MRRTAPLPRLASDIARSWYAIGGAAVAAVVSFVILVQTGSADDADELLRISLYLGWCTLVVIMASLTCAVYLPADPATLRSWLVATGPPPGPLPHLWWSLNGGGAIWWAITGAAVTMYTLVGLALDPSTPSPFFLTIGTAVVVSSAAMIIVSYALRAHRCPQRWVRVPRRRSDPVLRLRLPRRSGVHDVRRFGRLAHDHPRPAHADTAQHHRDGLQRRARGAVRERAAARGRAGMTAISAG
jgi:hypothetical protein